MLAGTISQVAFALAYRGVAPHGWRAGFAAGSAVFAASTLGLAYLHWSALPTFALVIATIAVGLVLTRRPDRSTLSALVAARPPRWDIRCAWPWPPGWWWPSRHSSPAWCAPMIGASVFFLALALTLPTLGLISFVIATVAALITQACTMFAIPSGRV